MIGWFVRTSVKLVHRTVILPVPSDFDAAVPSYKRSVELNSIFRHIKENKSLDALEESDDEAEFEDVREDRHVDLQKTVLMRCVYHKRFQKWEPVQIVKGHRAKLASAAEVR